MARGGWVNCECALLSVVVYMLLFTNLRCSVDIGDYYIVVATGHIILHGLFISKNILEW
jgi:hypothetical protein